MFQCLCTNTSASQRTQPFKCSADVNCVYKRKSIWTHEEVWSVCSPIHCKPVLGSHRHLWLVEAGQTSEETSLTAVTVHLYEYVEKKVHVLLFCCSFKKA